jgi:hypothetical protein
MSPSLPFQHHITSSHHPSITPMPPTHPPSILHHIFRFNAAMLPHRPKPACISLSWHDMTWYDVITRLFFCQYYTLFSPSIINYSHHITSHHTTPHHIINPNPSIRSALIPHYVINPNAAIPLSLQSPHPSITHHPSSIITHSPLTTTHQSPSLIHHPPIIAQHNTTQHSTTHRIITE